MYVDMKYGHKSMDVQTSCGHTLEGRQKIKYNIDKYWGLKDSSVT